MIEPEALGQSDFPADPMATDAEVLPFPVQLSPEQMQALHEQMEREQRVFDLQNQIIYLQKLAQLDNVAEEVEDERLGNLGAQIVREYKLDRTSRNEWEAKARRAMDLARQKKESKSFPWPDASNVKYPLLTTAALQFAARAYPAIVDGPRIVKCTVLGSDETGEKAAAADRVSQHMSYQLTVELPEWEGDMDTILHQIPIVGCAFKKVYKDKLKPAGFCSDMISAFDLVVNQSAKSLDTVPRISHVFTLYPHEIGERQRSGTYLEVELDKDTGTDEDAPHTFIEQHRYWDLDEDGITEPWIVTVHEKTQKVVRIKPGFDPSEIIADMERGRIVKIPRKNYFLKIPFVPDPEGGFYDVGFGHLLEPLSDVIDTTINQMMDAGTLQNAGGGFISAGVNLGKGKNVIDLTPGKYRTIQSASQDLRQSIYNVEHPGPSKTLFELLSLMIDAGKDIAAIQDILVGDMPRNQTATATMAMIEQGLKVFTAIYKRIFRALKAEYKMIFEINKASLDVPKYVALLDKPIQIVQADYMGELDVLPVSDPNSITDMQRMAKAQVVLEEAKSGNPNVDIYQATKRAFEAARVERIDEVLVQPGPKPEDEIKMAGLVAELEKLRADIEKTRVDTENAAVDAVIKRLQAMMPPGMPIPIAQPQFMPGTLVEGMGQQEPQPPMPMGAEMGPIPPEMIGGPTGEPLPLQTMPDDPAMLPPEIQDQIAVEQMQAGDAMPPDGMMQ